MRTAFWIWQVKQCESGDINAIVKKARDARLTDVFIKIADGTYVSNATYIANLVVGLKQSGIKVWGWQYTYGFSPFAEGKLAATICKNVGLDGFIIDAESEYKKPNGSSLAQQYCEGFKSIAPKLPLGISTYRYPTLHKEFPLKKFLEYCDFSFPQVYWESSNNPGAQLSRCLKEYRAVSNKPIYPVGPTYSERGWTPTVAEIDEFLKVAEAEKCEIVSFFSWDECQILPDHWALISRYANSTQAVNLLETLVTTLQLSLSETQANLENLSRELKNKGLI